MLSFLKATMFTLVLGTGAVVADAQETGVRAALRKEWESITSACSATDANGQQKTLRERLPGCGTAIFSGNKGIYPSIATFPPLNELALGAVVKNNELPTKNWRLSFQINAQASFNSSWTAGAFMKMQRGASKAQKPTVVTGLPTTTDRGKTETLVLNLYAFHTSLRELTYFGIGPLTAETDRAFYSMAETITGIQASQPLGKGFYLLGELNGRWPDIEGRHGESSPSIEQQFTEANTPGLLSQPGFLQLGIGARYQTNINGRVLLDYLVKVQQYSAVTDSRFSFRRFRVDLNNSFYPTRLFKGVNTDTGAPTPAGEAAPTTQRIGTLTLRGVLVASVTGAGHQVPFYFQPTLGGSDLDKQHFLASYPDYRFRAPNMMLLRAQYEQPLPKISFLGVVFRADTGKVASRRAELNFTHLRHSFGAGLTLRAGNIPYVMIMYAWGGREGTHVITDINLSGISASGGTASLW
jgi:hypothetical protein